MQSNTILRSDVGSTEKLMGNNNNLNNNGSPGADIMFQMEDEGLTQLGSVFQSAYQSIVGGGPQLYIERKPPDLLGAFHSREWRRETAIEGIVEGNETTDTSERCIPLIFILIFLSKANRDRRNALKMWALNTSLQITEEPRGLRQFDPYDKRTTVRFSFIGIPDIRSRKTPEDQQGDEFMAVSLNKLRTYLALTPNPSESHPSSYIVITKKHAIEADQRMTSVRQQENLLNRHHVRSSHTALAKEGRCILPVSLLFVSSRIDLRLSRNVHLDLNLARGDFVAVTVLAVSAARSNLQHRASAVGFPTCCTSDQAGFSSGLPPRFHFASPRSSAATKIRVASGIVKAVDIPHLLCVSSGGGVRWTPASLSLSLFLFFNCFRRGTLRARVAANRDGLEDLRASTLELCQGGERCVISGELSNVSPRDERCGEGNYMTGNGIEMDRSFKNNADFKMNQQNFKLSDFGIDVKSGHESKTTTGPNNQCKTRRSSAQVSQRYVHAESAHVRQIPMSPGRLASGSNLLQVVCNRSRASPLMTSNGNQHRNSPSQLGQLQNAAAAAADRFQTSSPSNLSGTGPIMRLSSSPSYWKQYGGQESGVNITREELKGGVYRDSVCTVGIHSIAGYSREQCDKRRDFAA
ncbi:hypothetical protein ALC62_10620 [Cyphomyrmex costatus]|uniref:Uncharacterized protein n=1 Tax=Cyphomyrmex costatus TaxID=456900 RepID=A0A195CCX7_9HYME|nr:hypothetical protein ALC62_10620 [Cyphomyrmex costatus]